MTLETFKKRFYIPFKYLRYVADPKIIIAKNGRFYHVTINKSGEPVATPTEPPVEETAEISWPKPKQIERINFT